MNKRIFDIQFVTVISALVLLVFLIIKDTIYRVLYDLLFHRTRYVRKICEQTISRFNGTALHAFAF